MVRKRIPANDRKSLILEAARRVFAEFGYDGAKTQRIAAEAKVSEALVYRHYASKQVLYRAVLRQLVRQQDENYTSMRVPEPSTAGLIEAIRNYIEISITQTSGRMHEGSRMRLASLAGEGGYVTLIYRRAQRKMTTAIQAAFDAAEASGDFEGRRISVINYAMFNEHIGTMINMVRALNTGPALYDDGEDLLLDDATWFCCRGIGLKDDAIKRHLDQLAKTPRSSS